MREACVIHWSGKQGAAGDGAGSTAWSSGARSPACGAWAPLWVTGYDNSCKRKRGPGCSSPSTGLDGGVTQRRRRRAPAAGRGRSFAVRALQGPPSAWAVRVDASCSYEAGGVVSVSGAAPAANNRDGATSSPEVVPARFRRYSRRLGRQKCTGSSLESWRGQRGARGGSPCSGATGPRRSRGAARPGSAETAARVWVAALAGWDGVSEAWGAICRAAR